MRVQTELGPNKCNIEDRNALLYCFLQWNEGPFLRNSKLLDEALRWQKYPVSLRVSLFGIF